MTDRLPPLNAVRAFVAAARHQSFTRAAVELHVTHSAISRQVKSLEAFLGTALFERRIRQVMLTSAGQAFFAETSAALAQIASAAATFTRPAAVLAVRIDVRPSFAVRWLIPQLPDFVARHPQIEPQVATSTAAPGRVKEGFDLAVRRGLQGWPPSIQVQPWMEDAAVVVGSPALLAASPVVKTADLCAHVLLSARSRKSDWDDWLSTFGSRRGKPAGRLQFDHLHLVLQAAADGLGLAMAPLSLVAQDLARGRLIAPLPQQRLPLERYYLGLAPGAAPQAALFVQWLLASSGAASTAA